MPHTSDRFFRLFLTIFIVLAALIGCGDDELPDGAAVVEAADPVDDELYTLGQALFFDKVLSGNRDISCATCHHPTAGTGDDLALSVGVGGTGLARQRSGGVIIARNAPPLFNLHAYPTMFWDGRIWLEDGHIQTPAGSALTEAQEEVLGHSVVAAQAMFPVVSREEMRGANGENELADLVDEDYTGIWRALMGRLGEIPEYVEMFEAAFPSTSFSDMTFAHAGRAIAAFEIAAFERTDSDYERFLQGDDNAMSRRAREGMNDFAEVGCDRCHSGPLLSNFEHHNTALAQFGPGLGDGDNTAHDSATDDYGRERVTGNPDDRYAFRTTPLLNVALTAPFGHAGQFATLREFVRHYRDPGDDLRDYSLARHVDQELPSEELVANQSEVIDRIDRDMRNLDDFETDEMVAFLEALTADSARDLTDTIPESVPSGLPLD